MGQELKRVPLDFSWPLDKTWQGFINPHYTATECAKCNGSGYSPKANFLKGQWYGYAPFKPEDRGSKPFTADHPAIRRLAEHNAKPNSELNWLGCNADNEAQRLAGHFNRGWSHHLNQDDVNALVSEGRLMDFTHTWTKDDGWKRKEPAHVPTADEVNAWSINGFGHDSINQWIVVKAECERLGIESTCSHCGGEGTIWPSDDAKTTYESWERTEPPTGDGYQIWQTVSEGSPITPVFATPEELATYAAARPWGGDCGTTYDQWLASVRGPGWAMSMAIVDGALMSGVQAADRT